MNPPLPPVLVVDDEKNMRRTLQTVLDDDGYTVRAAESAEGAMRFAYCTLPFAAGSLGARPRPVAGGVISCTP